jgi:hypothetical protein
LTAHLPRRPSLQTLEFELTFPSSLGARKREDRPGDIPDNDCETQQANRPHRPYPQYKSDDEADEAGENQGEHYLPSDISEHGPSSFLCTCGWPSDLSQTVLSKGSIEACHCFLMLLVTAIVMEQRDRRSVNRGPLF